MMRARITTALCFALHLSAQTSQADAQAGPFAPVLCAPGEEMRERLQTRYGAHRSWAGLRSPDEVLELWEDPKGDWTLVITHANGNWCIVAMGDAFSPFVDRPRS